jgi:hypothetical protein
MMMPCYKYSVQRNSFNPSPHNLALEETSPKTRGFAFYQKKSLSIRQEDVREMFRKAYKSVCPSTILISPDTLSPTPTSSAIKTPQNTEEDPDDREREIKEISKWDTPLISCAAQV